MSQKIVYFQFFLSQCIVGQGIRGGDKVFELFYRALELRGFKCIRKVDIKPCPKFVAMADYIVFGGSTGIGLKGMLDLCVAFKKNYIFIPFHEELEWMPYAYHFLQEVNSLLQGRFIATSYNEFLKQHLYLRDLKIEKRPIIEDALFNFVNSKHEALEVLKDYPSAQTESVYLNCGISNRKEKGCSELFLRHTGLKRGEYILQVGRLTLRKNQLASIMSTMSLKIPIVFIFTEYNPQYLSFIVDLIRHSNLSMPVFFLTPLNLQIDEKKITVIEAPISDELLFSAYQNAGLHLHPSYYECPGYTYLEAAKLAIPTVASSRSTLREYLSDENGDFAFDEGIDFVRPDDVESMTHSVKSMFGKKFKRPDLPIFKRSEEDIQNDMGVLIDRYMQ